MLCTAYTLRRVFLVRNEHPFLCLHSQAVGGFNTITGFVSRCGKISGHFSHNAGPWALDPPPVVFRGEDVLQRHVACVRHLVSIVCLFVRSRLAHVSQHRTPSNGSLRGTILYSKNYDTTALVFYASTIYESPRTAVLVRLVYSRRQGTALRRHRKAQGYHTKDTIPLLLLPSIGVRVHWCCMS